MSAVAKEIDFVSESEYLVLEEQAEGRNEYYDGVIIPVPGVTLNHDRISQNINFALLSAIRGKAMDCEVFTSNVAILAPLGRYFYPDLTLVCGNIDLAPTKQNRVRNPTVLIEVLSKSTRNYDLGAKTQAYRKIGSLLQYVCVDSESRRLIVLERATLDADWIMRDVVGLGGHIKIAGTEFELAMAAAYSGLEDLPDEAPWQMGPEETSQII